MTLSSWFSNSHPITSTVPAHYYQPNMPIMMDRYDHSGGGGGWVAAGHSGGHEKKAMKNPRTAFSALTLLAFLFFLNVLQSCLQQNMQNDNTNVNLMMNNMGNRGKRSTVEKSKGDDGPSFWTRYPPPNQEDDEHNKPPQIHKEPREILNKSGEEKSMSRDSRATGDWMSQSLSSIHASQLQGDLVKKSPANSIYNKNDYINNFYKDNDYDESNELMFQPIEEDGFFSSILTIARGWIVKVMRFFSSTASSYIRSRALMPECHAWAACETQRWSTSWGTPGQRIVHLVSDFLGWSSSNVNTSFTTPVEVARGITHKQKNQQKESKNGYVCRKQAYDCVTRDSKQGTEWWPFIASWFL